THANQGNDRGQLANRLKEFGDGLAALHRDLGDRMSNIVVITMTEFGRAIRQNGSGGTDHGHASSLFVLGGAVKGGKVYGKWPGLAPEQLYEGRDLALTTDFLDLVIMIMPHQMGPHHSGRISSSYTPLSSLGYCSILALGDCPKFDHFLNIVAAKRTLDHRLPPDPLREST